MKIYIVCGAADMRKGVDGLAAIVNLSLACDFSGESMFIFCNKSASEAICTQTAMRIWQTRCRYSPLWLLGSCEKKISRRDTGGSTRRTTNLRLTERT
ncbi:IS66 family insertion sequence element accessory protein TnpB [Cloacibacillus porcorum]